MAPLKSSSIAEKAANLAAQLALVESRGREECRGREKTDSRPSSRPSTGTVVSASGDSIKDSIPTSWAPSQSTTGHTSPANLDDSSPASRANSRPATGQTSPKKLEDSGPASWAYSKPTTGNTSPAKLEGSSPSSCADSKPTTSHTSPNKLEDSSPISWATSKTTTGHTSPDNSEGPGEANAETASQEPAHADPHSILEENGNIFSLTGGAVGAERLKGRTPSQVEIPCHSVAEAVEAFEAKLTRTKKLRVTPSTTPPTREVKTFCWKRSLVLGLTLVGLFALICSYHYVSEFIIIIKVKQNLELFPAQ